MHFESLFRRFSHIIPGLAVALAMTVAACPSAIATDIFNTLGSGNTSQVLMTGGTNRSILGSFFDLGGATLSVNSATFYLRGTSGGSAIPFLVSIFSSATNGTVPGTWEADFPVANATSLGNVTFTMGSPVTLSANKRYWFMLANVGSLQGQYSKSTSPVDSVGNSNITFSTGLYTSTYSNTTGLSSMSTITFTNTSGFTPSSSVIFSVDGTLTPVPEPSTYAMGLVAVTFMAGMARRRKAARV